MKTRAMFLPLSGLVVLLAAPPARSQQATNGQSSRDESAAPPASEAQADAESSQASSADIDMTLRDAYRREFAFLAGQKRQLGRRLSDLDSQFEREARQLENEIAKNESRLLALESRAQNLREELTRAEQATQSSTDDSQLIDATIDQARTTLLDYGLEVEEAPDDAAKDELLSQRFDAATNLLAKLSSVFREQGAFFKQDGTKTRGTILRIGRVAAYGVSDEAAGILAPAGGGKFKIWQKPAAEDARALAQGQSPDILSMFLYESVDSQVDADKGETAVEHVASGGAIAWVIVSLGAFGLLLVAIRALLLWRASSNTQDLESKVGNLVRQSKLDEATDTARRGKGSAARVLSSVLSSLKSGNEEIDDVVSESMLNENRNIHRFGAVILVIAAVAPLLGLLGTVTGMISTFDIITKFGTGDPKLLSGGISTALVTTELGLIVAIPTLLLGNLLRGWGDGIENDAERVVLRVVNIHKDVQNEELASGGRSTNPPPAPGA